MIKFKYIMKIITDIKKGLPNDKINAKPLLEQYNISKLGDENNGTLIFADGAIFITSYNKTGDFSYWKYFTRLKVDGVKLLKELIEIEFLMIENEDLSEIASQNVLVWKSFLNGKSKEVIVASGSYQNLPPVFQKIDNLINQFMYKMNEVINE